MVILTLPKGTEPLPPGHVFHNLRREFILLQCIWFIPTYVGSRFKFISPCCGLKEKDFLTLNSFSLYGHINPAIGQ